MEIIIALGLCVWVTCGILAYGATLGYFQGKWPQFAYKNRYSNRSLASFIGLIGPFGLFVCLVGDGFSKGLCFTLLTEEESWAAYNKAYPSLSKETWLQ